MRKTIQQLLAEKQESQEKLRVVEWDIRSAPYSDIILHIMDTCGFFENPADLLAYELTQRDEPLTRAKIKEIFDFSSFKYNESHLDAARPDSQETVDEQITYYRE